MAGRDYKGDEETFWDDGYVNYLDGGYDFIGCMMSCKWIKTHQTAPSTYMRFIVHQFYILY